MPPVKWLVGLASGGEEEVASRVVVAGHLVEPAAPSLREAAFVGEGRGPHTPCPPSEARHVKGLSRLEIEDKLTGPAYLLPKKPMLRRIASGTEEKWPPPPQRRGPHASPEPD